MEVKDIPKILFEEFKEVYDEKGVIGYEEKGEFSYLCVREANSRKNFSQVLFSLKAGPHKYGETISESSVANLGHPLYEVIQSVRARAHNLLKQAGKQKEKGPLVKIFVLFMQDEIVV